MKINKEFILREIAGDYVIVPVGETAVQFNGMISVNETGALLWRCLQEETDLEHMVQALTDEYDVSVDMARNDAEEFIAMLRQHSILD